MRDSPTPQLLEAMNKYLCGNLVKVYDPLVEKDVVSNQFHDFDKFLGTVDFVIILIGHREIGRNMDKLKGKIILDTRNICNMEGVYHL